MKKRKPYKYYWLPLYCMLPLVLPLGPVSPVEAKTEFSATKTVLVVDVTISGKVTDKSGEPIPGVTVSVPGTSIGTATDIDGNYTISVPEASTLVFSFIGFNSKSIEIGDQSIVNVALEESISSLNEVVVVGYGTQKKVNVIGSVTTVGAEEISAAPVGAVSNALAGRLPGGIFMQSSGEPGKDQANIRIRGNATLGNNSPLVVIDGIIGRDLNSLHPNDIESITVLKDASAGIYGARAANGVILVTTKRGSKDTPTRITYGFYKGWLSPTKLPEMADAATYATMIRENQSYRGVDESNMLFSMEDIEKYRSGAYPWTHPNTDWNEVALRDFSNTNHHNLSVTGGGEKVSYFTSFGTQSDDGIYTNSNTSYKRYNLRANVDFKINEYLDLGVDISGIQENRMYSGMSTSSMFQTIRRMYPTNHAVYPNGLPGPDIEFGYQPMVMASDQTGFDDDKRFRSNNIFSANLRIPWVEGLSASSYFAYDLYFQKRKLFQKPFTLYSMNEEAYLAAGNTGVEDGSEFIIGSQKGPPEPRLTDYSNYSNTSTFNFKIDYTKTLNDVHNIDAFVAYEQNEGFQENFNAYRRYFVSDQLPYLFAGGDAEKDNAGSVSFGARQNYFGRISYNFKEIYLFQFSFRRDGSVNFSKEAGRWGNFPSVLAGWRPSEYDWWKNNLGLIDQFKLKASWGQMGNDLVSPFQYLASYGFVQGLALGDSKTYLPGLRQQGIPNPNITWEKASIFNLGWESLLFDTKLGFDADFFYERRSDILVQRDVSIPRFVGFSLPDENFGIVDNYGVEVVMSYDDQKGDIGYGVSGNFAFARNRIIESDEPERPVPWQVRTGHPQGALLLYKSIGIFRDEEQVNSMPHIAGARPGDIIIEDYDNDGEITTDDRQLFPLTTTPEITFGLNLNFSYKNWELTALVQGHGNAIRAIYDDLRSGTAGNYFQYDAEDRWTPENIDATKPRAYQWLEEYWRNDQITDYNYANVSYARLKNLQITYNVPRPVLDMVGIESAKVYTSGQNLWLIYSGNDIMDPEVSGMGAYPIMRVISVGAQISF
ncbi:SusC/RagA family TonB-linked outer membrane protein [Cyclobacterium marinum]|uniref:TonB-dependent receptor plug n=1 Tax=Cyclobacterium marinum (strain ATCC 25205 / DSM 745 / LMG 13164 / NCIMB 1802) TaxID=880070 RepID=G0J7H0_CYCMS|nr:TonB-dependent receptor [Cyclobacterium marinum]AEL28624.1 TonB-dependent receptor plug [Cyclobacterium marinum DSM 745]